MAKTIIIRFMFCSFMSLFKLNTTGSSVKNGMKYLVEMPKSLKSPDPTGAQVKYWIM